MGRTLADVLRLNDGDPNLGPRLIAGDKDRASGKQTGGDVDGIGGFQPKLHSEINHPLKNGCRHRINDQACR